LIDINASDSGRRTPSQYTADMVSLSLAIPSFIGKTSSKRRSFHMSIRLLDLLAHPRHVVRRIQTLLPEPKDYCIYQVRRCRLHLGEKLAYLTNAMHTRCSNAQQPLARQTTRLKQCMDPFVLEFSSRPLLNPSHMSLTLCPSASYSSQSRRSISPWQAILGQDVTPLTARLARLES
jgi:hypothetical protein